MASPLAEILKEELLVQRIFLSSDEEQALDRPVSYDEETDLAWDRIKHRRLTFYGALRDRFILDRRPADEWRQLIRDEIARAGEPTYVTQIASQVLEWSVRTSDRGAMFGGFLAKLLTWIGTLLVILAGFGWFQGFGTTTVVVLVGLALLFRLAGRIVGNLASERVEHLVRQSNQLTNQEQEAAALNTAEGT